MKRFYNWSYINLYIVGSDSDRKIYIKDLIKDLLFICCIKKIVKFFDIFIDKIIRW